MPQCVTRSLIGLALVWFSAIGVAGPTPEAKALIQEAMQEAPQMSVQELKQALDAGEDVVILDIRQTSERPIAGLLTADDVHIPRGYLEIRTFGAIPDRDATIVVYCGKGIRSAFAANKLKEMGYSEAYNLQGGALAWKKAGYSTLKP